jgi:hypothetical protein
VGTKAPEGSWKSIDSSGRVFEGPGEGDRPLKGQSCVRVVSEPGTVCIFQEREEKGGKKGTLILMTCIRVVSEWELEFSLVG